MRRRSRVLVGVVVCVLLGAVAGVVVAWSIALGRGETGTGTVTVRPVVSEAGMVPVNERRTLGSRARWIGNPETISSRATPQAQREQREAWRRFAAAMPSDDLPDRFLVWGDLGRPPDSLARRRQYAFGFPVVCVWYERSGGLSMFGSAARLHGGFEVAKKRSGLEAEGAIGYRPIWAGLAVNAVVYGVVWMGVMKVVGGWRARRRTRAGCCRRCGYSLKELPDGAVCPECGSGGVDARR